MVLSSETVTRRPGLVEEKATQLTHWSCCKAAISHPQCLSDFIMAFRSFWWWDSCFPILCWPPVPNPCLVILTATAHKKRAGVQVDVESPLGQISLIGWLLIWPHRWICEPLVTSVGLRKNLESVKVDDHHFNLLGNRRGFSYMGLGPLGPPSKNHIGDDVLKEKKLRLTCGHLQKYIDPNDPEQSQPHAHVTPLCDLVLPQSLLSLSCFGIVWGQFDAGQKWTDCRGTLAWKLSHSYSCPGRILLEAIT